MTIEWARARVGGGHREKNGETVVDFGVKAGGEGIRGGEGRHDG